MGHERPRRRYTCKMKMQRFTLLVRGGRPPRHDPRRRSASATTSHEATRRHDREPAPCPPLLRTKWTRLVPHPVLIGVTGRGFVRSLSLRRGSSRRTSRAARRSGPPRRLLREGGTCAPTSSSSGTPAYKAEFRKPGPLIDSSSVSAPKRGAGRCAPPPPLLLPLPVSLLYTHSLPPYQIYPRAHLVDRRPKRHARRLLQRGEDRRLRLRDACELRDLREGRGVSD
jgi:hypothetical protein